MMRLCYVSLIAVIVSCLVFLGRHAAADDQATINCAVLEVHASTQLGVTAAIFHQASKDDAARFGTLLKSHSDTSAQFQTSDGAWHQASVARLKSSFGRGLLLFAAGSAQLKEKDNFVLKFGSLNEASPLP